MAKKTTFVLLYTPGPKWVAGRPLREQDLQEHRDFLAEKVKAGNIEGHGPFADSSGGMVIMTAQNFDEAARFLAADPAIIDGVFVATIRQWDLAYHRNAH